MYRVRIHTTAGTCREFKVEHYDYALERIEHYRNNWALFKFATLAVFDECWIEIPV